jgi:hypothetical protein
MNARLDAEKRAALLVISFCLAALAEMAGEPWIGWSWQLGVLTAITGAGLAISAGHYDRCRRERKSTT